MFRRGVKLLTRTEAAVLEAVAAAMAPEARALLERQLRSVNRVDRSQQGREVLLYALDWLGRPRHVPDALFPNRPRQANLARITLAAPGGHSVSCRVVQVFGQVFSLCFSSVPPAAPIIRAVKLELDPLADVGPTAFPDAGEGALPDWLLRTPLGQAATAIRGPLPPELRTQLAGQLDVPLPEDYRSLLEGCNGFVSGRVSVLGVDELAEVAVQDQTYLPLVEVHGGGVIAARAGPEAGLHYLSYGGDPPRPVGATLLDAIDRTTGVGTPEDEPTS
jgi:hypothetical protein